MRFDLTISPAQRRAGIAALLLTTLIWGTTFPTTKALSAHLDALQIMVLRYGIASLLLLPCLFSMRRTEWRWGLGLAALGFFATWLQFEGLMLTSSNRNAFITGLSVLMVPMVGYFIGHAVRWTLWLACVLASVGMAILFWESSPWNLGDSLTLLSALFYALYIHGLSASAHRNTEQRLRALHLTAIQMWTLALGAAMLFSLKAWFAGQPLAQAWQWSEHLGAHTLPHLAYLGIFASIGCIAMQIWGQQRVMPVPAALIYGLEPVFAALAAWVLLGEYLTAFGWVGASLLVSALVLGQTAEKAEIADKPDSEAQAKPIKPAGVA